MEYFMETDEVTVTTETVTMYKGGYCCQFEDDSRKELEDYRCAICLEVIREAHEVICCKQVFCNDCLQTHFRYKSRDTCPHCRGKCEVRKRTDTDVTIQSLRVRCSNPGCSWTGLIRNFEIHTTKQCSVQLVSCPYCKKAVQRQNLGCHVEHDCLRRSFKCLHCGKLGEYQSIMEHMETECPEYPIVCSNSGCFEKVKRKDMDKHRSKCMRQSIPCEYSCIGCHEFIVREEMASHSKEFLSQHLEMAKKTVCALNKQLHVHDDLKESQINRVPIIFKIDNFSNRRDHNYIWTSPPFFTHPRGYKMCLQVYTNGASTGKESHVSAYIFIMSGPFDKELRWPFLCLFEVALLNQAMNDGHLVHAFNFLNDRNQCGDKYNQQVPPGKKMADVGIGEPLFISHTRLGKENCHYLKDDCIYISVRSADVQSMSYSWLTTIPHACE